jgi:endonuclease I
LAVQIIGLDMKQLFLFFTLSITSLWAQIPNGYYNDASGQTGTVLHQSLSEIIDNHNDVSYSSLWTHYQTTDVKPNGKVWDMYSHVPDGEQPYEFTFVSDQCGNYSGEGSCYNREHSWPKSWFGGQIAPMNSDMFHVVPSDGYVNGQRGNLPYGEVSNPTWTSLNGSKKGPNTYPGYSGTVFEPIDDYKGDFARNYFYMSTRYLNEDSSWPGSDMVDGAQLEEWALNMMMDWHATDPVSQKELDRNNAIHDIQLNRNPFIDHPEYADLIWGDPPDLPDAPSNLGADNITETYMDLTWSDNSDNESGFYIYQDNQRVATLATNVLEYAVDQLQAATTYGFAVSAFNSDGESSRATLTVSTTGGGGSTVTHFIEDFESGSGSSYLEGDFTLSSGTWSAYQAGNFALGTPRSGSKCISINDDKPGAHITTPAVNSLGTLSFYYYQRNGAATDEFQLEKSINGAAFESVSTHSYNVGETYTLFTAQIDDTSSSVRMRIINDDQAGHLIVDDLTVTQYDPVSIDQSIDYLPENLMMNPAYPNPFNPEVTLSFQISEDTEFIQIQVFDIQGELLATPLQNNATPRTHSVTWDGTNQHGEHLPSGIYLVKLSNSQESKFQRITLLR